MDSCRRRCVGRYSVIPDPGDGYSGDDDDDWEESSRSTIVMTGPIFLLISTTVLFFVLIVVCTCVRRAKCRRNQQCKNNKQAEMAVVQQPLLTHTPQYTPAPYNMPFVPAPQYYYPGAPGFLPVNPPSYVVASGAEQVSADEQLARELQAKFNAEV